MADRLAAASKTVQQCAQIIFRSRISRPQPEGLLKFSNSLLRTTEPHKCHSQIVVQFCVTRLLFQRSHIMSNGLVEAAGAPEEFRHISVRAGMPGRYLQRLDIAIERLPGVALQFESCSEI